MPSILVSDNRVFYPKEFVKESELEALVKDQGNLRQIFGDDAVLFPGKRISECYDGGAAGRPDGFILLLKRKKWIILEIELSTHNLHDHITPQMSRFNLAWKDSQKALVDRFFEIYKEDPAVRNRFDECGIKTEVYHYLSKLVSEKPLLAIVIDAYTTEIEKASEWMYNFYQTLWTTFSVFQRDESGKVSSIYQFRPLTSEGLTTSPVGGRKKIAPKGGPRILNFLGNKIAFLHSKEIPVLVAEELAKRGVLRSQDLPWGPGKRRYLVSTSPVHPGGNDFFQPQQMSNGWWIETHASESTNISHSERLIRKCGLSDWKISVG